MMKDETLTSVAAIIGLSALESVAMVTGNDGALFLPVVAAISGLGGFTIGAKKNKTKKTEVPA